MKRKLEARRRKLLKSVSVLWYGLVIGDNEKFRLDKEINNMIDDLLKQPTKEPFPQSHG